MHRTFSHFPHWFPGDEHALVINRCEALVGQKCLEEPFLGVSIRDLPEFGAMEEHVNIAWFHCRELELVQRNPPTKAGGQVCKTKMPAKRSGEKCGSGTTSPMSWFRG
jgi:hypothetical protein